MKIRVPRYSDAKRIDELHNKFFPNNEYLDYFGADPNKKLQCSFVVTDNADRIITAGGVKLIAEMAVVTDLDRSVRVRQEALLQALGSSILIAQGMKYGALHTFVSDKDEEFAKHLLRYNFRTIKAKCLALEFD